MATAKDLKNITDSATKKPTTPAKTLTAAEMAQAEADAAALGEAARDLLAGDFVGIPLKFNDGEWFRILSKNQKVAVGNTAPFIVDVLSYVCGWVKWIDKKPVVKDIGRKVDGFRMKLLEELPDRDGSKWPTNSKGVREDPWQPNYQVVLRDVVENDLVTWNTTSWYGSKAIGRLLDTYKREFRLHLGLMPVVLLSTRDQPTSFGVTQAPVLTIVDWKEFGEDASPPGLPPIARAPALVWQPQLALPTTAPKKAQVTTGVSSPGKAEASKSFEDPEDEIPF